MHALQSPILTPATCLELDAYLHDGHGRLSPSDIANLAIREWLARPENTPTPAPSCKRNGGLAGTGARAI